MTSVGAALTILFSLLVLAAPRRWAAVAVIGATCYLTQGQQIYKFGFHFTAIRIVLLLGVIRCVCRRDFRDVKFNGIDWAVGGYALSEMVAYSLREKTSEAFTYMLGCSYDIFLAYFVFRGLIHDYEETKKFFRGLVWFVIPFALLMSVEALTGNNLFRAMGGQGWDATYFREGRVRAVGSFRGPHTAGVFGATLVPIFFGLGFGLGKRGLATIGIFAAGLITVSSNSSGPLLGFVSGGVGMMFWFLRHDMKMVRRGLVFTLVSLHLVMKVPVWFLFAKMGVLTGGDGETRSLVIDRLVRHFSEWWLLGTSGTARWVDPTYHGEMDVTNQYVASGINGGLLGLIFYILIITRCFRALGIARHGAGAQSMEIERMTWCLGAALFAHVMAQFTVAYFDQIHVPWWGLLGIIASATSSLERAVAPEIAAELLPEDPSVPEIQIVQETR